MIVAIIALTITIIFCCAIYRHQRLLKERAELMKDAIRHRDFSFRLPTNGLFFGERALQDALNNMGDCIEKLEAHNEVESWQRLSRVLTHEIMNATTPIISISQAYIASPDIKGSIYEEGVKAILDTSMGLASFVDSYRKMTLLQEPMLETIRLQEFCHGMATLFPDLTWEIDIPPSIKLNVDAGLLRQAFINLVKNAMEAEARTIGIIHIMPQSNDSRSSDSSAFGKLLISNDGHVIPEEVAREIFIPFFTTKKSGSGIGLSLSRQILLKQGMLLNLSSFPTHGYNVTFILEKEIP